jgi:hypothetical protein
MPARCWSRRSGSHPRPIVVDARPRGSQPGWLEVLTVAAGVVVAVAAAAALTGILPDPMRGAILNGPVMIGVLIVGTGWLLWRISRGRPVDDDR